MSTTYPLGDDAVLYYSATLLTSTSYSTPLSTATALTVISDVNIELSRDVAQFKTRGETWVIKDTSKIDGGISFTLINKPSDAGFTAVEAAFIANSALAIFALDQARATTGAQGPAGNFKVAKFARKESIGEFQSYDVELVPSTFMGWCTV